MSDCGGIGPLDLGGGEGSNKSLGQWKTPFPGLHKFRLGSKSPLTQEENGRRSSRYTKSKG